MELLLGFLGLFGILVLGIYLANKISTRKANSYDLDPNNNLAQKQTENNRDQQNHP